MLKNTTLDDEKRKKDDVILWQRMIIASTEAIKRTMCLWKNKLKLRAPDDSSDKKCLHSIKSMKRITYG